MVAVLLMRERIYSPVDTGRRLRERRLAAGYQSEEQLAIAAGVAWSWINGVERGESGEPSGVRLYAVARTLGTTIEYLLWGEDSPELEVRGPEPLASVLRRLGRLGAERVARVERAVGVLFTEQESDSQGDSSRER